MQTICNIVTKMETNQQIRFLLECISVILGIIAGNKLDFLLASSILSVISFLATAYYAIHRSDRENALVQRIELVFSAAQVVMTSVYSYLAYKGNKFDYNFESLFPLLLAITHLFWAYKQNEPASPDDENPNVPPFENPMVTDDNPEGVNGEGAASPGLELHISSGTTDTSRVEDIGDSKALSTPNQSPTAANGEGTATPMDLESHISSGTTDRL